MAAPITGRNGRLYVDTSAAANGSAQPISNLNSFSINQTASRTEVTSFGDQTLTYVAGLKDAQGDFTRSIPLRHCKIPGVIAWEVRSDLEPTANPSSIAQKQPSKAFGQSGAYEGSHEPF